MRHAGFTVPPRSRRNIYDVAARVRGPFRQLISDRGYVQIDQIYEVLPVFMPGFRLEICDPAELGNDHGQTFPDRLLIKLREDVYSGMCDGVGRDRFTAAHELGHLFMHGGIGFARRPAEPHGKPFLNSEWQADEFASALLIDERLLLPGAVPERVASTFGVSVIAAQTRLRILSQPTK